MSEQKKESTNEDHIERLVDAESKTLREKLYQEFSKPVSGSLKVVTVHCVLEVQEI